MTTNLFSLPIKIPIFKIENFCRRNHINKLSLFGSVLRDDFTANSDVDLLVEFQEGKTPGLAIIDLQDELSEIIGREVDLRTPHELSHFFRDRVLSEAVPIYDQVRRFNQIQTHTTSSKRSN
ncbi:nucleotidyltransferase family protein [Myxosarcina sp. GI1]|uniref:nucleotidyltransferase family protein n=1 Tax=Myxosarcina sp. GI1 TaxID=1541065 RepID=UPI00068A6958|nr:nucleotidyltransferase [Myxosarcina sp. GI1]